MGSDRRYTFDGRFILDRDNPEARLYVQSFIDALLRRAEKAEADCKAMAAALTPIPSALVADGMPIGWGIVWGIALDAPTDAVVRRWRP